MYRVAPLPAVDIIDVRSIENREICCATRLTASRAKLCSQRVYIVHWTAFSAIAEKPRDAPCHGECVVNKSGRLRVTNLRRSSKVDNSCDG